MVLADVLSVFQHGVETAVPKGVVPAGANAPLVQRADDGPQILSVRIPLEYLPHHRRGQRVYLQPVFLIQPIPQRDGAAVTAGLEGILPHPTVHLLGQLRRVVFRHSLQHGFQDDALRAVGNALGGRDYLHSIFSQLGFVVGAVVPVAGETVQLPDQHRVEQPFGAVPYHPLEFRAVVRLGGQGPVDVTLQYQDTVSLGVFLAFPQLSLDAFLSLVVAAVSGVDDCFHWHSSLWSLAGFGAPPQDLRLVDIQTLCLQNQSRQIGQLFSSTQYHRKPLKAITNLHNLFCRIYAKEYRLGRKTLPSTAGVLNPAAPVLHATVSGRLVLRRWQSRLASAAAMRGPDFPPPFWAIALTGLS